MSQEMTPEEILQGIDDNFHLSLLPEQLSDIPGGDIRLYPYLDDHKAIVTSLTLEDIISLKEKVSYDITEPTGPRLDRAMRNLDERRGHSRFSHLDAFRYDLCQMCRDLPEESRGLHLHNLVVRDEKSDEVLNVIDYLHALAIETGISTGDLIDYYDTPFLFGLKECSTFYDHLTELIINKRRARVKSARS